MTGAATDSELRPALCPRCGGPDGWEWVDAGALSGRRVLCEACIEVIGQEERALRARATQQFPELPSALRTRLVRAGLTDRARLAEATDTELLATPGVGSWSLAQVRAVFPQPHPLGPCPHCGGTGWQS